jgi:hypothetical protein
MTVCVGARAFVWAFVSAFVSAFKVLNALVGPVPRSEVAMKHAVDAEHQMDQRRKRSGEERRRKR